MSVDSHGDWVVAIDFGTTFTAAAVRVPERTDVLTIDGERRLPSCVLLASDGTLVVGCHAERQAALAPDRFERTPKVYLQEREPGIVLGGRRLRTSGVVARIIGAAYREALNQRAG